MKFTTEIMVTEKCNLGCPYCYVANRDLFMTEETLDKALTKIELFAKRAKCDSAHISWFGGEPLLNWPLLEYGIPEVKKRGWSQNIISNMTLITPEISDFCKQNEVSFSWSFDGKDANKSRPLRGGGNILDVYKEKWDLLREIKHCKVMVYPDNFKNMTENLDFFIEHGILHPDFTLVRDGIWTSADVSEFAIEAHKLAERWVWYIKNNVRCTVGFFMLYILDTIFGITYGKRSFGCFACSRGAAISVDGRFYPCARFATQRLMEYGPDHDFAFFSDFLNPQKYESCAKCDLYRICNAGCTYSQLREGNKPVPAVCDLLHILYAEAAWLVHELRDSALFSEILKNAVKNVS